MLSDYFDKAKKKSNFWIIITGANKREGYLQG